MSFIRRYQTLINRTTLNLVGVGVLSVDSGSIAVPNSSYVKLKYQGCTPQGSGGGDEGFEAALVGYLTLTIIDATHVKVVATRQDDGGGSATLGCFVAYELFALNPQLVKSVQRGILNLVSPLILAAVVMDKTEVELLGQVGNNGTGVNALQYIALTSTTQVTVVGGVNLTVSAQVIEGY